MYDHILHRGRKHFCRYCIVIFLFFVIFVAFSTGEILKSHIKDCFKINGKQRILSPKKVNTLNSKVLNKKKNHHI